MSQRRRKAFKKWRMLTCPRVLAAFISRLALRMLTLLKCCMSETLGASKLKAPHQIK